MRKLVDSGWNQKTFESEHAPRDERLDLVCVSRYDATPNAHIHPALILSRFQFRVQAPRCGCRRNAVQRHIDQRSDTAGGGRSRAKSEAFPVRAPGIIEMDVRIDKTRKHDAITRINHFSDFSAFNA